MSVRLNYTTAAHCEMTVMNELDLDGAEDPEDQTVLVIGQDQDYLVVIGEPVELLRFAVAVVDLVGTFLEHTERTPGEPT